MTSLLTYGAAAWAWLEKAWPELKKGLYVLAGALLEKMRSEANANAKLADTYQEIIKLEQANGRRPVAGAAARLRNAAKRAK